MCSAAQLVDFGCRWPVVENILYWACPWSSGLSLTAAGRRYKNKRYGDATHERSLYRIGRQPQRQRSGGQACLPGAGPKYHPDNYVDNPLADLAEEKMKEINEAYEAIQKQRSGGGGYQQQSSSGGGYRQQQQYSSSFQQ